MPLWDDLAPQPLPLTRVLEIWKRDAVDDIILFRDQARQDRIITMWVGTENAWHLIQLMAGADPDADPDAPGPGVKGQEWDRSNHEPRTTGAPQGVLSADTFMFSECVKEVTSMGGDRQYMIDSIPDAASNLEPDEDGGGQGQPTDNLDVDVTTRPYGQDGWEEFEQLIEDEVALEEYTGDRRAARVARTTTTAVERAAKRLGR